MAAGMTKYGPCPSCEALNLAHREHCYRCRKPLPKNFGLGDVKKPGLAKAYSHSSSPNTRGHARRAIHISGAVLDADGSMSQRVAIRDISTGGLQVCAQTACRIGASARLELPLEGRVHPVEGVVRYCRAVTEPTGRFYLCGIEFTHISPLLHRLICHL